MNDDSLTNDTNSETSNDTQTRSNTRKSLRKEGAIVPPEPELQVVDHSRKSMRSSLISAAKPQIDEQSLLAFKNQLIALTVIPNNLKQLKQIATTFSLTETSLLKQCYGFDPETPADQLEPDQNDFLRKIESASRDLIASSSQPAPPRALLALKYELPMVYIDLLGHFLETKSKTNPYDFSASPENQEVKVESLPSYSANAFYNDLYELSKRLATNRNNADKISELVLELKNSIASKVS